MLVPVPVTKVYTEVGAKRVFAGALDWPGWCRNARDEKSALEALVGYGTRYSNVVSGIGLGFPAPKTTTGLEVVERLEGDATTDFGAPAIPPAADSRRVPARELARQLSILEACWAALDLAAKAAVGVQLTKGPRGGGRDLDAILGHVAGAEGGYVRRLAAKAPDVEGNVTRSVMIEIRGVVLDAITRAATKGLPAEGPRGGKLWTARYFVRRTAWHALDHAWEIEDRSVPMPVRD